MAEVHPVSSSAQLTLVPWLLGWPPPDDRTRFAAGLHAGSAAGLALALRSDLAGLAPRERRRLVLSAVPAALAGAAAHRAVEERLGRPGPTAALLAGAGVLLWAADRRPSGDRGRTGAPPPGWSGADLVVASLAQVPALAPGVSRSGATLTALRARGVPRPDAYRASLLMSLPVALGAAGLTAVRSGTLPAPAPTALAAGTAWAAARSLHPSRTTVRAAVTYRLLLATAVAVRLRAKHPHKELR